MHDLIPEVEFRTTALPKVGFEIIDVDQLYHKAASGVLNHINQPHRINFHNLLIFTQGTGKHFVDFSTFPVEKNTVILINKGQVHAFDLVNKPKAKLVIFTDDYLAEVTAAIDSRIFAPTHFLSSYQPNFSLQASQTDSLLGLITLINNEYQNAAPNSQYLKVLFAAFLTKISEARSEIYHPQMSSTHIKCFERFILDLQQHYTQIHDANDYAARIGTSYKTLNKICKDATNRTVKQLIDAHIVLEAKRRLSIDNVQVQQISYNLGFNEVTNFVKYFKKHTLMTPSQFKKLT